MPKSCIINNTIKEIFTNVGGKPKMVHKALCELGGLQPDTIIVGSLYNKAKRIVHLIQRLKNCRNEYGLKTIILYINVLYCANNSDNCAKFEKRHHRFVQITLWTCQYPA
jgi:hypothetical protein